MSVAKVRRTIRARRRRSHLVRVRVGRAVLMAFRAPTVKPRLRRVK